WLWGVINPHLAHRGLLPERLIAWGLPLSFVALGAIVGLGADAGWPLWAAFCVGSTFVALSQPAVAQALPPQAAGRALSAFNLVIFAGIFVVQWSIGLVVDAFGAMGWSTEASFRGAVAVFGLCCLLAYGGFLRGYRRHVIASRG
ncbi:MAG: MFS transporter, partial [Hydrogenophaga sp.]|nr:MFS transporter [Hydrogenophaga sp.]